MDLLSDLTNQKVCERSPVIQVLANSPGYFATIEETNLGAYLDMSLSNDSSLLKVGLEILTCQGFLSLQYSPISISLVSGKVLLHIKMV